MKAGDPSMLQCVITQKQLEAITDIISLLSRAQKSPGDLNSFQTNLQIIYPLELVDPRSGDSCTRSSWPEDITQMPDYQKST